MFEKMIERILLFALDKLMREANKHELEEFTIGIRLKKAKAPDEDAVAREKTIAVLAPRAGVFTRLHGIKVGTAVKATDVLGHIKALNIAIEVKAGFGGVISELPTDKAQAVEYEQHLASIKPEKQEIPQ